MIIKAKVLPFHNDVILPPIFSNSHKQYLIEKNKSELSKILRSKKPKNQKVKRYLNKVSEIKNIDNSKFMKVLPSFTNKADNINLNSSFNSDKENVKFKKSRSDRENVKFKKSRKVIFKKTAKRKSDKILKPSSNLSADEMFSILDGGNIKQLRSGTKYKFDEE